MNYYYLSLMMCLGFLLGLLIPATASRFGKVLPADPGLILYRLWHKPHFPKVSNTAHTLLLQQKWKKLLVFSVLWGMILGALFGISFVTLTPVSLGLVFFFLFMVGLSIAIDEQYYLLPDFITIPLLIGGFAFSLCTNYISLMDSLIGACFGYFLSTVSVFIMSFFSRAEFGAGDAKMVTALGAWLGYLGLNIALVLSFCFFLVWAWHKKSKMEAYGPALGFASIITLFILYIK